MMADSNDVKKKGKKSVMIEKNVESIYKKVSQIEHVLLRPDTYVGSIRSDNISLYSFDDTINKILGFG